MSTDRWTPDDIAALITDPITDRDEAATWVAVILAESAGDPVAYNLVDHDPDSSAYLSTDNGLFQINSYWHGTELPVHEANRPELAWPYAWSIATSNGQNPSTWGLWTAYRNGAYLEHLETGYEAVAPLTTTKDTDMQLYEPAPGWNQKPAGRCRTGMQRLSDYLVATYGADDLGCYVDKPKTGGSSPSLHRDGRAIDIGFDGKLEARDNAFRFLVEHATVLGVQMVLNYKTNGLGGYRWRLPYTAADQNAGIGPFGSVGHWLHIERTNAGADDPRTIPTIINPIPKETMKPFRFRHTAYADQFSCDAGGAMHMTPARANGEYKSLPLVEDGDTEWLIHCCNASGFDFARLTPM
ncbi:MAG: hypothetical protein WBM50_13635 [Acidimicrobiales bacterium]